MKKKGNISLLVMFVLVACSLLGLLTVHFLKSMSTQYGQISSYYRSYYLAKAGIETALTQLQNRGLGFSETIGENSTLIKDNIDQNQSSFSFSILGKTNFLSASLLDSGDCQHPFILNSGQSLVLPLYIENFDGTILSSFGTSASTINLGSLLSQMIPVFYKGTSPGPVNFGLLLSDEQGLYANGVYFTEVSSPWSKDVFKTFANKVSQVFSSLEDSKLMNWADNKDFTPYFVIANKDRLPVSFCISLPSDKFLASQQYLIQSFGTYGSIQTSLEATYKQTMPSFLVDSELGLK